MESNLVENVPGFDRQSGKDIMQRLRKHAVSFNVQFTPHEVTDVNFNTWPFELTLDTDEKIRALTVIYAAGSKPNMLGVKGEDQYYGSGVSTCAICDASFFEGLDVAVVGGGDSAVVQALLLASHVKSVTMLVRSDKMRATPMVRKLLDKVPNISIMMNTKVIEVCGGEDTMTHLILEDTQTSEKKPFTVKGLFLAIGHIPNTVLVKPYIQLTPHGHIITQGRSQLTSKPGVFACGECVEQDPIYRQVAVAEGDGTKAGLDAVMYMQKRMTINDLNQLQLYRYTDEDKQGTDTHDDSPTPAT